MKTKSYFTRKLEHLENNIKNKEKNAPKNLVCEYCGGRKNPWSKMCQHCYVTGAYKDDE